MGQSQVLSATDSNKSVAIPQDAPQLRVHVAITSATGVYVRWSTQPRTSDTNPAVDTAADMYLVPGAVEVFTKMTAVALGYKCPTGGTATLYITPGSGP